MESSRPNEIYQSIAGRKSLLLLGPPRILVDGNPVPVDRHKAIALMAYLVMTGVEHHRDRLAEMLWPEFDGRRARAALRRALASLTQAIPGPWWVSNRETLYFRDCPEGLYIDVCSFHERLRAYQTHEHSVNDMCESCLDSLTVASQLYQGDFMEGFTLGDCPGFDDWQRNQAEELRRELIGAIERLMKYHTDRKEYETVIRYGLRWARIDPLDEQVHFQLMQVYLDANQRNSALREYVSYKRLLQSELGVMPQDEITQLYESIKADKHMLAIDSYPALKQNSRGAIDPYINLVGRRAGQKRDLVVGRENELALAHGLWQRAVQGVPCVLVVSGDPGIGKSHLTREIKRRVRDQGGRVLDGECSPDGDRPYACVSQVIVEGMRTVHAAGKLVDIPGYVLADLARLAPEVRALYPGISVNPRLDPQSEQQRIFESVFLFLKAVLGICQAPLMLVVEDIHWADADSLVLLRHLAHRTWADRLPLLITVTLRDTETGLKTGSSLRELLGDLQRNSLSEYCHLAPLNLNQTRVLLQGIFLEETEIVDGLAEAIQDQTEGNPFFIIELYRDLIEEGRLIELVQATRISGRATADLRIPASIREVILGRVQRLSAPARQVLHQAAFLNRPFDVDTLSKLCGMDEENLFGALEEAGQAQLIRENQTPEGVNITFAHILIPLALRASISRLRRKGEFQRVADFLEIQTPEDTSALAYYCAAAENRPKAMEYAQLAARKAISLNAYEDALMYLRSALDLMKSTPSDTRLSILEDFGDVHRLIGEGIQAVSIYQEALDVWRSLPRRERWTGARLHRKIGDTVTNLNQFADVQRLTVISRSSLETGLASVQDVPPQAETVRLLAALARDAWYMRSHIDWAAAENYATQAVAVAETLDQPVEISIALEALSAVYGLKGKLHERVGLCRRRLELSFDDRFIDLNERVNIYLQTGMALYDVGEYYQALEYLREAEILGGQIWDIPKQADALVRQGQCLFRLDRWDDLLAIEKQIRSLQARFTYRRMGVLTCFYYAIQSAVCTWRGELDIGNRLKSEAQEVMTIIAGSELNWVRNQHY